MDDLTVVKTAAEQLTSSPNLVGSLDPQALANLTAAVQSILVSVAVLIGGIWTLFTFRALNMKKKAEAELAELNHKLSFKPLINISVKATSLRNPEGEGYLISATVLVENVGNRDTTLFYPRNRRAFFAMHVRPVGDGDIELGNRYETGIPFGDSKRTFSRGAIVYAGARVELPFILLVPVPGVFLLAFSTYPAIEDKPFATLAGAPESSTPMWTGRAYIVVEADQDADRVI